ncbi:peptide ABC transporter substrate-binding protein [Christensenellaceae bacterium OttesenSCG-928-M15]|nr:peptide ABC transporter substrate-binding protein [Christensenellaceae bacterium OttesenSCG-928-M15]
MKNMKLFTLTHSKKHRGTLAARRAAALFLCLSMLLIGAACNTDEAPVESTNTPTLPEATIETTPQPALGGQIVMPITRNPFLTDEGTGANPLRINTEEMRTFYQLVYEPLLRQDINSRLAPALAERWSVDDTGRTWTIELRENVVWHQDAHLFTADDVTYTIDQLRALGAEGYYHALVEKIESYEKIDDHTLHITMRNVGACALYALTFPIVCSKDQSARLNGTGPYMLESSTSAEINLIINPRWWQQPPYIEKIRCLSRESNEVALASYEAGQLNFVPTNNVAAGKYREEGITRVQDVMTQNVEVILINHARGELSDVSVRQAIAYAIDRAQIVSNVYMNRLAVSDVPVAPDSFLYDSGSKIYDYDLTRAAGLLAAAGWTEKNEDGYLIKGGRVFTLSLLVNESTESTYRKSTASILVTQLQKVGIMVEVESARLTLSGEKSDFEQKLEAGDFDLAMAGYNIERSGDLTAYLSSGGVRNYGRYQPSETISQLLRSTNAAFEEKDMRETHAALQQAFVAELPFIVIGFRMSSIVHSANIQNMVDVRGSEIFRTIRHWYINTAT